MLVCGGVRTHGRTVAAWTAELLLGGLGALAVPLSEYLLVGESAALREIVTARVAQHRVRLRTRPPVDGVCG